ncbi:GNAT family N-acetyltransferase [Halobacillus halophilus]|uniref:GNAT family N-acetyltransferase n=1 Tax=Halobacillus halophilus TaxID=1570 RepID=UPI001CD5AE0E|nr:GNAT family N-acetyltransferase [Halobacillus halophilus]MCA1011161.1 GNAT family N-acetyltransferase [Halobacillus halophilus]
MEQVMNVQPLSHKDRPALEAMDTGIEDDYVIRIFEKLIESDSHEIFGLFKEGNLLSVGGYSLFGNGKFAMLGRLRSDRRMLMKGNATELLKPIVEQLLRDPQVAWVGANTHLHNLPARRVLQKISLEEGPILHFLTLKSPELLTHHKPGPVWEEVTSLQYKKDLLHSTVMTETDIFPYECYYPLPYDYALFTDQYLEQSSFYQSPDASRFVIVNNDTKKFDYSHVKYFWDDHYNQSGFFETILHHWKQHPNNVGCWIDFSAEGFKRIPDLSPYDVQEPWALYSKWK